MTEEQLEQALQPMGLPAFRSRQIRGWLEKGVGSFEEMTNLPLSVREALKENFCIPGVRMKKRLVSAVDDTVKYLYALPDGETVESVLMSYHHGWSQCLSTQVGCRMAAPSAPRAWAVSSATCCRRR